MSSSSKEAAAPRVPGWGRVARLAGEPLVQFFAAGAVLFGLNAAINGAQPVLATDSFVVSEGRVQQIVSSWELMSGRKPTPQELEALVDDFITEEIDYREAVAMGLDQEDTVVRRRMRQKLEFLIEDAGSVETPPEAELRQWYADHASDYVLPGRYAIRQVLSGRDAHGAAAEERARESLALLKSGGDPAKLGDSTMLPAATPLLSEQDLASLFGRDFASGVAASSGGDWFGPVPSEFGYHVVQVLAREPGRTPDFKEIRQRLSDDWMLARRDRFRDESQARLRARYDIRIEWPDDYASLPEHPAAAPRTRRIGQSEEE